jgi:hypothetical protein
MKKHFLMLILAVVSSYITVQAQVYTTYGESAGTGGFRGSYFGRFAGHAMVVDDPFRGTDNSFFGDQCGMQTTADFNTGVGSLALNANTTGDANVAVGARSMLISTTGRANTAVGTTTLNHNTTGSENTAVGVSSMVANDTGSENVAVGGGTLSSNIIGKSNVAVGNNALSSSLSSFNTAVGYNASSDNAGGVFNASFGSYALRYNTSGSLNSAFGYSAGPSSGTTTLTNTTALGAMAVPTASNQVRIGNNSVTSIGGRVGWSVFSDGRFKTDVKEDVAGLEFITKLRPVSYLVNTAAMNQFMRVPEGAKEDLSSSVKASREQGFIAQEVEALVKKSGYVFTGVEAPQNDGDHYSIRYSDFVVPLVRAVQELAALVKQQENEIAALKTQQSTGSNTGPDKFQQTIGAGLYQNSPNPFNVDTNIGMSIPEGARGAVLMVYSLEGKQIKSMSIDSRGETSVKIQANELAPGIYIYTLMVDGKVLDSKKMILTGK